MSPRKPRSPASRPAAKGAQRPTPRTGEPEGSAQPSAAEARETPPSGRATAARAAATTTAASRQGTGVRINTGRVSAVPPGRAGRHPAKSSAAARTPGKKEPVKKAPAKSPKASGSGSSAKTGFSARWRTQRSGPGNGGGAPGTANTVVSFPEPAGRKTRRRLLIVAGIVVVVIAVLLAVIFLSPALAVKSISIEGAELTESSEITEALEPLKGTPLARVGEREVYGHLDHLPAVESVEVVAKPPSELHVRIIEHLPVAVLKDGKKFVLIDESGTELATVAKRSEAKLPLIDGAKAAEDPDVFASITGVLSALPPTVLEQLDHASAQSVDSVELQLASGQKVLWGNAGEQELKATVLQALLQAKGVKDKASVIDVSTPTRPVTR